MLERPVQLGPTFDPETDISSRQWRMMTETLEAFRNSSAHNNPYAEMLFYMYMLLPERLNLAQIANDSKAMELMVYTPRYTRMHHDDLKYIPSAVRLKVLFPESDENSTVGIDDLGDLRDRFKFRKAEIKRFETGRSVAGNITDELVAAKILFPEYFKETIEADTDLQNKLVELHNNLEGGISDLAWLAANIRLLFPERFNELNFGLRQWELAKEYLYQQQPNWQVFAWFASVLKILAAEKVEVTDRGIELTMPSKEISDFEPVPLPETRRF